MKINLRSVDLNLLTVFVAIWEERHMSRAAERLGMTQSAASHALARLRTQFDDELFLRSRQGMQPTPRADALAAPIRDALEQLQQTLTHTDSFEPGDSERQFTIAFARYGELSLLPLLMRSIEQYGGNIQVRSYQDDGSEVSLLVKENAVDIGFDYRAPKQSNMEYCLYEEEEMVVIAREDHPRIKGQLTVDDYFAEAHVVLSVTDRQRHYYENVFSKDKVQRRILAQAQQAMALPYLVMQTEALSTIPRSMAESPHFSQGVRVFPLPIELPRLPIYMIWHRGMHRDPGHEWLREQFLNLRKNL